ncbi:MAG: tetratricopeptide repeat protein [Betaproteobacteria bacterium]|nr:tetratricopeptide repeat protein [Betaproteobacteria bacterium]
MNFPEAWQPWLQQLQTHVYAQPQRAIEAARELLKVCRSEEHLAYVYEQMGFAHLLLGEHRLSCLLYEQARALQPQNMYVLANLAHALYELGEHERAVACGREAMQIKDQEACQAPAFAPSALQAPHHGPQNLLSFSLYGQQARYCEMAVLNVMAARRHLPDFVCRFHTDSSVPPAVLRRLQALGAQCVPMGETGRQIPATMWRFLAMDDPGADCVLVRDVDALIDAREARSVQDWRASGLPFHIIRDDCCHTELILAGLFGIRSGVLRGIGQRIAQYLQQVGPAVARDRYADQLFLRRWIWPTVRAHALTHDRIYGYGTHVQPLVHAASADQGPHNTFIGANHATGRVHCELEQTLSPQALLCMTLTTASGALVCRYPMQPVPSSAASGLVWDIHLPLLYTQALQQGRWQHTIAVHPAAQAGIGEGSLDALVLGMAQATTPG